MGSRWTETKWTTPFPLRIASKSVEGGGVTRVTPTEEREVVAVDEYEKRLVSPVNDHDMVETDGDLEPTIDPAKIDDEAMADGDEDGDASEVLDQFELMDSEPADVEEDARHGEVTSTASPTTRRRSTVTKHSQPNGCRAMPRGSTASARKPS